MDVSITIQTQVPAGTSLPFRGSVVPFGYLREDGSSVSNLVYPRLFEAIGYTYGGSGEFFNLPNSMGRVDVGSGLGAGLTNKVLGAVGGEETHVLSESEMPSHTHIQNAHNHGITDTGHTHNLSMSGGAGSSSVVGSTNSADPTAQSGRVLNSTTGITINNSTAVNQNTGGGAAHNNMQPFLVATKMIKY